jgi:uncharacterized protein
MSVHFEWDRHKAAANLCKHRVSFDEASTVFDDPAAFIFDDKDHSADEPREIIIGHSISHPLLLVCFTERPPEVVRPGRNARIMKKTVAAESHSTVDDMRTEYRFDYRQARPNRFAGRTKDRVVVVLDPDISTVFTTPEAVNTVLRALISTMPQVKHKTVRKSSSRGGGQNG